MLIPLKTVIYGLSEMSGQGRMKRDDCKALVGELITKVYDDRVNRMIERMESKRDAEVARAKNSL